MSPRGNALSSLGSSSFWSTSALSCSGSVTSVLTGGPVLGLGSEWDGAKSGEKHLFDSSQATLGNRSTGWLAPGSLSDAGWFLSCYF